MFKCFYSDSKDVKQGKKSIHEQILDKNNSKTLSKILDCVNCCKVTNKNCVLKQITDK